MISQDKIRQTAQFYFEKNISVHITLLEDKWVNGIILSVSEDRLVLLEDKFGEMLIFLERIRDIVPKEVRA